MFWSCRRITVAAFSLSQTLYTLDLRGVWIFRLPVAWTGIIIELSASLNSYAYVPESHQVALASHWKFTPLVLHTDINISFRFEFIITVVDSKELTLTQAIASGKEIAKVSSSNLCTAFRFLFLKSQRNRNWRMRPHPASLLSLVTPLLAPSLKSSFLLLYLNFPELSWGEADQNIPINT